MKVLRRRILFLALLGSVFSAAICPAQITITSPGVGGAAMASCEDYATAVLNDPWDMSESTDINRYMPTSDFVGFTEVSFGGGAFSAAATSTDPYFHLLTPPLCSAEPSAGRFGSQFPIDTSKYHILSVRMFTEFASYMQVVWNVGCDYFPNFVITDPIPTLPGWNVYTVDLNTIGRAAYSGINQPWNAGPVTGLRIDPTAIAGAHVIIDWVSLYGETSCAAHNVELTASPAGDENRLSAYVDDDSDPFNGYIQQIASADAASGNKSYSVSALGLPSADYQVTAVLSGDYATLVKTNPWDMNDAEDIYVTAGLSTSGVASGYLSGTTSSGSGLVYLKLGPNGIDASQFKKLSFGISRSASTPLSVLWIGTAGTFQVFLQPSAHDVYQLDLAGQAGWTGTITHLMINPANQAGVSFWLDWVSLRSAGYRDSLNCGGVQIAPGLLRVNKAPLMRFLQPDAKGGQGFAAWNMGASGDVVLTENLDTAEILPFNAVGGLVGDFFHGANQNGNDDPINYSTFFTINPAGIDTAVYHNLTYKLLVEGPYDLVLGSVARVNWSDAASVFGTTQDVVVFEGWNEYTVDLATAAREDGTAPWSGIVNSFRVDPHEFTPTRGYYFDYIHLRADDRANEHFAVTFDASDPDGDSDALDITLFYNTARSTTGGVQFAHFTLGASDGMHLWDTSALPAGTYYVYAAVSDGYNTTVRLADAKVVVTREWQDTAAPILSLNTPTDGYLFDTVLQLKGYALDAVQLAEVQVRLDDQLFARIRPSAFDKAARELYPTLIDSSNAGFNILYDTSAVTYGAHLLTVRAIDTAGNITESTMTVVRQNGASPELIGDPTPDGTSLPLIEPRTGPAAPLLSSLRVSSKGTFSGRITNLTLGCIITLRGGRNAGAINDMILSFNASSSQASAGARLRGSKVTGYNGSFYARVTQDCGINGTQYSEAVKISFSKKKKKSYSTVLKSIRSKVRAS